MVVPGVNHQKLREIFVHPIVEIGIGMKGIVFLSIQSLADIPACLLCVSAAGTDALRQVCRQFVGIDLPDTAAHGNLVAVPHLIVHQAYINLVHLQQEITDQPQNIGITGLGMNHGKTVLVIVAVADHGNARNHKFLQGQIGIAEHGEQALVGVQRLPHVHVPGIVHL